MKGGSMVKRINALIPDEMHKALRVKLAEDGANFSYWLRGQVTAYLKEKSQGKRRSTLASKRNVGAKGGLYDGK